MIYFMFSLALALNSNCDFFKSNSGWSVVGAQSAKSDFCFVNIVDKSNQGYKRTFSMNGFGSFAVSVLNTGNSAGSANSAGTKIYYILPLVDKNQSRPAVSEQEISITHPSGVSLSLNAMNKNKIKMSGCAVDVQPLNRFQNSAGFDLKSCEQRLVFDFGFSRGGMGVTSIPTGTVIIKDSSGHQCRMINQQLVDYAKKNADPSFPSNTELKKRLKSYCSDLDLSPLDNQPRRLSDQKSNSAS